VELCVIDAFQVLVVGGGAAGIGAARRLSEAGIDSAIVEARPRLGGRAWTVEGDYPLDLGCGWLHSADRNALTRIAEEQGKTIDRTPPPWTRSSAPIGFPLDEQKAFGKAMHDFFERLDSFGEADDRPASELLDPGGRWNALIGAVATYINGVELERMSAIDFERYEDTDVNWRVAEGYGAAIVAHASELRVILDCPVSEIDHSGRAIRLKTAKGVLSADAVIVTVSTPLIAEGHIRFTPDLPDKRDAAAGVPLGLADKLYIALDRADDFEIDSRLFGRTDTVATAAYHMRPFGRPMIEAYFGGDLASGLEREGPRAYFDFAESELVSLLGSDFAARIKPIAASRWRSDPCALGSYSYASPGHADDRARLATPVEERLFFAGEACSPNFFSTAHGAYVSGREAADQAVSSLRRLVVSR
jgi:monoamine oxidase